MNSILKSLALVCAMAAIQPSAAAPLQPVPLEITDVVLNHGFQIQGQNIAISPDSQSVVTTLCDSRKIKVGQSDNGRMAVVDGAYRSMGCDLWRYDLKTGTGRQITEGKGSSWSPSWSPDGSRLAFISDRTGKPQLWIMDLASGGSTQASDARLRQWLGFEVPLWLDDGQSVLVRLRPKGAMDAEAAGDVMLYGAQQEEAFPGSSVVVFRSPAKPPSAVKPRTLSTDTTLVDLAVIDTRTGSVRSLVENASIRSIRLSPDKKRLAILETSKKSPGAVNVYELSVLDFATGKRQLVDAQVSQGFLGAVSFSPDSRKLAYLSADEGARKAARLAKKSSSLDRDGGDLYLWDGTAGESSKASGIPTNGLSNDFLPPLWSSDGKRLFLAGTDKRLWTCDFAARTGNLIKGDYPDVGIVMARSGTEVVASDAGDTSIYFSFAKPEESRNGLARLEVSTGKILEKQETDQVYGSIFSAPAMTPDGSAVVFPAESAQQGTDLWAVDAALGTPRRITVSNPQLEKYQFGKSERFAFNGPEGKELHAGMLLPANYEKGKRYPLLLWVYASNADTSKSVNRFGLVGMDAFNMQMLATRGYVVIFPEIPTNRGTPVKDLLDAVNPAIDKLVEMGIADPERVAVMGNSNGGYSTLALITQTDRFKAAVMNSGFGDLGAFYGTMGGGWIPWLEDNGGSMGVAPWAAPEQYIQNSPFYHLDKIKTPLIIQAGASDHGIIQHSDQVWVGMNKLQKEVIYLRYGGESHVLAGAANLQDYWQRVLEFLDQKMNAGPKALAHRLPH